MSGETFDLDAVNRFVLRKQHLADSRGSADVVAVARDLAGLHNTGASTPYLSLFARVPGFTREMLDEEMYGRKSLVRIRCMRNTMFVLPRDMLPAAFTVSLEYLGANMERFVEQRGVSRGEYEAVSGKIVALLANGGRTIAEIKRAVGPGTNMPAVLLMMSHRGIIVRGKPPNWRSNAYRYHLFSEYLPDLSPGPIDGRDAILQLARSYFAAYGPATADDFAWWSGIGKTKARSALTGLPISHVRINGIDGDFLVLRDDLRSLDKSGNDTDAVINMLPVLDPYVMGYKMRDRYLSRDSYGFVFDRSGNSTNTIVIGGRLCGVWDADTGGEPLVKYFLFEDVGSDSRKKVVAEASRTGQFIFGRPVKVRECRSMQSLPERTPGTFLSPLRGQ